MSGFLISAFLDFAGPVTLAAVLAWIYFLARYLAPRWGARRREWGITAIFALVGAAVAFLSTTVDFKVLSDETNLLSVANMLALFGKASNTEMWTYYYHTYHALIISVPSRPILFSVLTAIVHMLGGVRASSPFVVNFFCLAGLFFLFLHWAKKVLPSYPRITAFLALLTSPVLLIVSTSAGFDLCSVFFGFLSCMLWEKYLAERSSESLHALVFTVVCFASVRYETIVALPLLFAGLWWVSGRRFLSWKLYAAALFLVLPLFAQRILTWGSFENPPGVAPFSFGHFVNHAGPFFRAFFLNAQGPYPVTLHWLGLSGLLLALRRPRAGLLLPLIYGVFLFFLLLCHHFGFAEHPTQARLFLPLTLGLSALGIYFLAEMKVSGPWLVGIFALLFAHHHQYTQLDPLSTQLTMTREVRLLRDFLGDSAGRGDLFVYDRPGQLMALGQSAVSWTYFNEHRPELLMNLRNRLYDHVYVIERVKYAGPPEESGLVREGYTLTPVREHQLSGAERLRIARVEAR